MLLTFKIYKENDMWLAECIEEDIVTQASTLDELFTNIKEAVEVHFYDPNAKHNNKIDIITINKTEVQINA